MQPSVALLMLAALFACSAFGFVPRKGNWTPTALDEYLALDDPTYRWENLGPIDTNFGGKAYLLNVTSQTWWTNSSMVEAFDCSQPVWYHYATVVIPNNLNTAVSNMSAMYIDGGNTDNVPTDMWPILEEMAMIMQTFSVHLFAVPNEPITFPGGERLTEDGIIAYTWRKYMSDYNATGTANPYFLLRFPMVKAAVKTMDAVTEFIASLNIPNQRPIDSWVIAGASKRGWTTWLTGAVDARVVAMAPIVMPIPHMIKNIHHQFQCYGNWTFAFSDYVDQYNMEFIPLPAMMALAAEVDPASYFDRIVTVPKYSINALGDEFFLPDDPQFWWNDLAGEKHLRMIPNCEHTCFGHVEEIILSVSAFARQVMLGGARPSFTWTMDYETGTIVVNVTGPLRPTVVKKYWANTLSPYERRDFRLVICENIPGNGNCLQNVWWNTEDITDPNGDGIYVATVAPPDFGWQGMIVELTFDFGTIVAPSISLYSTEALITPNTLPFPMCNTTAAGCQPNPADWRNWGLK